MGLSPPWRGLESLGRHLLLPRLHISRELELGAEPGPIFINVGPKPPFSLPNTDPAFHLEILKDIQRSRKASLLSFAIIFFSHLTKVLVDFSFPWFILKKCLQPVAVFQTEWREVFEGGAACRAHLQGSARRRGLCLTYSASMAGTEKPSADGGGCFASLREIFHCVTSTKGTVHVKQRERCRWARIFPL